MTDLHKKQKIQKRKEGEDTLLKGNQNSTWPIVSTHKTLTISITFMNK